MALMNARLRVHACILFLSLHTLRFLCLCRDQICAAAAPRLPVHEHAL
jgi:hypothetical protein